MPEGSALERKLKREVSARKAAEALLEQKSLELFTANQQLEVALKQVEERSQDSFKRLELQERVEKILIHFGRTFLRTNPDDVLVLDLVRQLNAISDQLECEITLPNDLLASLTFGHYGNSQSITDGEGELNQIAIAIEVEQLAIGTLEVTVCDNSYDSEFVTSQMSLVCELISSALSRQMMNKRLIASKERAEASERSTREFLAMINHELRTPLNGLLGSVELLADTDLSEPQKDLHHNLSQSGQLLRAIINDLLDYSKINAGMLELIKSEFAWSTLEKTLRSIFEYKADEKQIGFNINASCLEGMVIHADLERLTQVFVNLIGNAIKFTHHGQVDVNIQLEQQQFVFEVKDTGIGISEQAQERLFQPFIQVDRSSSRNYEGTGLGLAICKKLIEVMGGEIQLSSELGVGTRFEVRLPLPVKKIQQSVQHATQHDEESTDYSMLDVLVVDDIKLNQVIITKMLHKLGITADLAVNGLEAVQHASAKQYDIIFMDCRMPVMDGFEATKQLRDANYSQPIVALTAGTTLEERQTCFDVGMDDILSKPYTANDLKQTLSKWGLR
ncbi:ATP-binding protein [Vibrio hippocampi]|uniref:histidine kinase n=1 Tax=Vibrio hippocampi TaxID=654686 RepID=A0ABM8ZIC5_9VIBR|nr:ATP-binding protein [Vibrio hippocampi]CAH0525627.1 Sensor histidine kinase RcsC [Vibrio hippocampi]